MVKVRESGGFCVFLKVANFVQLSACSAMCISIFVRICVVHPEICPLLNCEIYNTLINQVYFYLLVATLTLQHAVLLGG